MLKIVKDNNDFIKVKKNIQKNCFLFFIANFLNIHFGIFEDYCVKMKYYFSLYSYYMEIENNFKKNEKMRIIEIITHKIALRDYSFNEKNLTYKFLIDKKTYLMSFSELNNLDVFKKSEFKSKKLTHKNNNVIPLFN